MAQPSNIKRNLESGEIYIPSWINGLHVNRSPLFTPISAMGVQVVSRFDTLWGGSNMELSMQNTLVRRPGFPQWCNQAFNAAEWPLQFCSYKNLSGVITTLVDTQTNVYSFTPTTKTNLITKSLVATQTSFQRVGQVLYMASFGGVYAAGDTGLINYIRPVGLAVPTVAPQFSIGTDGFLTPSVGFTFGFSYASSIDGHVSTMSPISVNVGDINVSEVSESSVTYQLAAWSAGSGTVVFGTPNGNNLWIGAVVKISGLPGASFNVDVTGGYVSSSRPAVIVVDGNVVSHFPIGTQVIITGNSQGAMNNTVFTVGSVAPVYSGGKTTITITSHVSSGAGSGGIVTLYPYPPITQWTATVTAVTGSSFSASTTSWGSSYSGATFASSPLTGCTATLAPITIPPSPYVYTVNQAAIFAPTNAFGAASPSPMKIVGPSGSPVYTQIASGTPATGQYVVNAATGAITFAAADTGKSLGTISYAVTPKTGGTPASFILTGPSTNNPFSGGTQTDTTGYAIADSIVIYRDQDSDTTAGPWYFLAVIPNNLAIVSATFAAGGTTTVYTLASPCPAGTNNGFAGAPNTKGATIAGFSNSGNNGVFDIVASSATTITCTNSGGVNETAAATVNSSTWTYTDTGAVFGYAFDLTVPDGELDILIQAPIASSNNPPPNTTNPITTSVTGTFSLLCFGAGRLWGAVDNYVYFAGGPDVTFGNGNESWPPANVFTFPGDVTAIASVPAGIIVFTSDEMWIIYGTSTSTFYSAIYQKNLGVASQNSVVLDGDSLFIYSNQGQLWSFTNSLREIGLNIAPLLQAYFPPASTYLAMHKNGADVGLFIADGSTNYIRYRLDENSWSPMCQITGGVTAFQSIETSVGVYTLLVGASTGAGYIAARDLTTWTDIGGTYTCYGIVGSLTVAPPGATAVVEFLTLQYVPTGTAPTVSILPQDFATLAGVGNFVSIGAGVNDPPKLLPTGSTRMTQQRWYVKGATTPIAQEMCNLQVKISFPAQNFKAEVLTLGVQ